MSWRPESDKLPEQLDGLLEEFFQHELGRELPPLPPSARPASGPNVRPRQHGLFGVLLAACIACLMLVVYRDASTLPPREPQQAAAEDAPTTTGERPLRLAGQPRYVLFDEPSGYDVRRVSSKAGDLIIRQRSSWRHLVWQEPEVDTTIWMAFPVIDIEWSMAQADTDVPQPDASSEAP